MTEDGGRTGDLSVWRMDTGEGKALADRGVLRLARYCLTVQCALRYGCSTATDTATDTAAGRNGVHCDLRDLTTVRLQ